MFEGNIAKLDVYFGAEDLVCKYLDCKLNTVYIVLMDVFQRSLTQEGNVSDRSTL